MPIKPARLAPGDIVGIVSPASPPPDPRTIDRAVAAVERLGFKPRLGTHARKRFGYLAGTDNERAADLMEMFTNREVAGILCVRGGYGTSRLLPMLDYAVIRKNPKIFCGYSDITAVHCALLKRANLVTFHGPTLNSDFVKENWVEFTVRCFLGVLTGSSAFGAICDGYDRSSIQVIGQGVASGPLVGGNLSLLCGLVGTPYEPDFKDRILFLEDVDEAPYRIDRMLTHLLNAGLLQQVAGIAVGVNRDCVDPKAGKGESRQTVEDVLKDRLSPLEIPVVAGLPFGHVSHNATLPLGVEATLDGTLGELRINEPAVK
jgi:muramoyltetrapeptide carboxypeptidase